ncbi:MAG: hypothetical protein SFV54_16355 [Bryobacteraceae bacterium]|nr:hypothetical protein [Bryobacteraceae bacterium]
MASNNSGVWNEIGDTLEFSIAPAHYQTVWFYASCMTAFLAMLWGLYRLTLYQIRRSSTPTWTGACTSGSASRGYAAISQSFQPALIQMQAAQNLFERRPEKAQESLLKAIARGRRRDRRGSPRNPRLVHRSRRQVRSRGTARGGWPGIDER